jgi:hypothetical protein
MTKSAYFESTVVIGAVKRDLNPVEDAALFKLLRRRHDGQLRGVTSEVVKEELQDHALGWSPAEERMYRLLLEIPMMPEEILFPPHPVTAMRAARRTGVVAHLSPVVVIDALLGDLERLLKRKKNDPRERNDARHIFQAVGWGADYFVTTDSGILNKTQDIERLVPIRVVSPSQLEAILSPS